MTSSKTSAKRTEEGSAGSRTSAAARKTTAATTRRLTVKRRTLGPIGALEDFIPYKLAVVANRVSQSIGHLFETKYNLQMPEWRILMALYAYGDLVFNEVVDRTSMDKARVSRAQRRLVDLKMITTSDDPNDGRRLFLALTPMGIKRCAEILPDAAEREAWFLGALDDEEHHQLDVILNKLMARSQELT
jgi:DNA-binding MarR family transcriptional regulator